jgi:hypothetical protein
MAPKKVTIADVDIEVKEGDALTEQADVLVLKYAQALYGVDALVVDALRAAGRNIQLPEPWEACLEDSLPAINASRLLFIGVPPLHGFGYREIRTFALHAIATLAERAPKTRHVLLTVHGPGYGLDEIEAFEAELAGLVDAVRAGNHPEALQKITIIEYDARRAKRLAKTLVGLFPERNISKTVASDQPASAKTIERLRTAGNASDEKAHVFVAMPFKDEMYDTYYYGIERPIKAAGLLCERADLSTFTGDVLEWVRSRIRSAHLVVADLTDANPNVYLEVGYAWGVGIPTVLVVNSTDHLKFDVRGQRCLVYKKIKELEDLLTVELKRLHIDT